MRNAIFKQESSIRVLDQSEKGIVHFYSMLQALERYSLNRAQALISPSKACQKAMLSSFGIPSEKVNLIYNGVNTNIFQPNISLENRFNFGDRPIVLFVGRFVAQKGLETLVKAMPRIVNHVNDALFVFVGPGSFEYVKNQIERYGISSRNFINLGYYNHDEVHKIYSIADVFVLPSPHENCSLSLLEAMSCARAVVAADVGGNPEIIEPSYNGLLFSAKNSDDLANRIIQLLEDSNLRKILGRNARKTTIQRFSVQSMAAETTKVYKKVLEL
jgi:glycosyltransferase involved in cell wall biosynthesis